MDDYEVLNIFVLFSSTQTEWEMMGNIGFQASQRCDGIRMKIENIIQTI